MGYLGFGEGRKAFYWSNVGLGTVIASRVSATQIAYSSQQRVDKHATDRADG